MLFNSHSLFFISGVSTAASGLTEYTPLFLVAAVAVAVWGVRQMRKEELTIRVADFLAAISTIAAHYDTRAKKATEEHQ